MRRRDPGSWARPLPAGSPAADASVRCVVMCWPAIDPLGRYQYAKKLKEGGKPYPEIVDRVLPCHDQYWQTEEAMAEGNPVRALERGERVEMPPAVVIQGTNDAAHPRPQLDRFVTLYRQAGGPVEVALAVVAVASVGGTVHAFDDTCRHEDCSLAEGELAPRVVPCPCHFAEFDIRTGAVLAPPATVPLKVYPVRVEGNDLQVEV